MQHGKLAIAFAASLGALGACQRKEKAPTPVASASNAVPPLPANVDAELLKVLKDISTTCKVEPAEGGVTCTKGENRKLTSEFSSNTRKRPAAVATLAAALSDANPALQTVAANVLNTAFRAPWGSGAGAGSVRAADAKALLQAAVNAPKPLARQAIPGAVNAAFLAGIGDDVYAALDKADQAELAPLGYRYVMTYGRLSAFGKVQQLAKDPNPALAFAALEAPRNMYGWDEAERAAICPWALELLQDPRPNMGTRAAGLLGSCSGEFVDKLLERGEKAFKIGQFSSAELAPFRDLCSAASLRQPGAATTKQCEQNRKLLTAIVSSKKLESQTRSMALVSLAYQWPDDKTLKLAQSLRQDADKGLAERASATIKRLEERKASQKAAGAAATKPPAPAP